MHTWNKKKKPADKTLPCLPPSLPPSTPLVVAFFPYHSQSHSKGENLIWFLEQNMLSHSMRGTIRDWKTLAKTRNSSSHTFFLCFFVSFNFTLSTASSALRSNPLYLCLRSNANPSPPVLTSLSFSLLHDDPSCGKTSTTNRTFLVWL